MPTKEKYLDPAVAHLKYEEIFFESQDHIRLHSWYFPAQSKSQDSKTSERALQTPRALVLHFHGNAENLTSHFRGLIWLALDGYDYAIFDYRGYGQSAGSKNVDGAIQDTKAAILRFHQEAEKRNLSLILYGQSLGGTLMLRALADLKDLPRLKYIVIESSFYSYQQIAREKLSSVWFLWPFQWLSYLLVSDQYSLSKEILQNIPNVQKNIYFSKNDPVVPEDQTQKICDAMPEPRKCVVHTAPGHCNTMFVENEKYRKELLADWHKYLTEY